MEAITTTLSAESPVDNGVPPLRWVSFITGTTPESDYHTVDSEGVDPALRVEIKDISVAFHPHNQIRYFPQSSPVVLFWQAKSTGDYIVDRVTLDAAGGGRPILEGHSLILSPSELAALGNDPFVILDLGIHNEIARTVAAGQRNRIPREAATAAAPVGQDRLASAEDDVVSQILPDAIPDLFAKGGESRSTREELHRLEAYCRLMAEKGEVPHTFASWWESDKRLPADYFAIVLRANAPRVFNLRKADQEALALTEAIRVGTPYRNKEADSVRIAARVFLLHLRDALRNYDPLTPAQFEEQMAGIAGEIEDIGKRLLALQVVEDKRGGATIGDGPHRFDGETLAARSRQLGEDLRRLKHPNPLASNPENISAFTSTATRKQNSTLKSLLVAVVVMALIIAAMVGMYFIEQASSQHHPGASPTAPPDNP